MTTTSTGTGLTDEARDELLARIRTQVGVETDPVGPYRDPVSRLRINLWCDAMEDQNPVYTDDEFAASTHFGGIVAPPTMLQVWMMPLVRYPQTDPAPAVATGPASPFELMREAGYSAIVATNCEQEYLRYLRPGETVTTTQALESLSDEKQTLIGRGMFQTRRTTVYDAAGEPVGYHRFRTLHYLPGTGRFAAGDGPSLPDLGPDDVPDAPRNPPTTTTRRFADLAIGQEIDELVIPMTPLRIVATAMASGDFEDVHHDVDGARRKSMSGIFMNILSDNGMVGRFVTDWAGPEAIVESVSVKLGSTAYSYDTLRYTGTVTDLATDGAKRVTVTVRGVNRLGDHVVATVVLLLPH